VRCLRLVVVGCEVGFCLDLLRELYVDSMSASSVLCSNSLQCGVLMLVGDRQRVQGDVAAVHEGREHGGGPRFCRLPPAIESCWKLKLDAIEERRKLQWLHLWKKE